MNTTLIIMAAGMGSRYGGLKQLDPMGPHGETVLDYSVYDAIRAGFEKVVFVIRRDFEAQFKSVVGHRFEDRIVVEYAYQAVDDLPAGYALPAERTKPWGTAHAVRAARAQIDTPFAVINADDFYGRDAFAQLAHYFENFGDKPELQTCMVGYPLCNTLSAHGTVNRGICRVAKGILKGVEEHTEIGLAEDGCPSGKNLEGEVVALSDQAIVSMNFWGFTQAIFEPLEAHFEAFLQANGQEAKSEYYLPSLVDSLIKAGEVECPVLQTESPWFGVTYPEDKARVVESIQRLTDAGVYSL